ncbi:MAG: hypothetical protein AB1425_08940 [Actinomycetota bacterium]
MPEHVADFEWRGEGEDAEIAVYAPDELSADRVFERALAAARLPGVESPVHAAASPEGSGLVVVSASHAAPSLAAIPARGLMLVAEAAIEDLEVPPRELERLVRRNIYELSLPSLSAAGVRRLCEEGAFAAAENGLIPEEDLAYFVPLSGDPDALVRRSISAGTRDWDRIEGFRLYSVGTVLDASSADELGLKTGMLIVGVEAEAGDLGRVALTAHRDRILSRARSEDLGAVEDLPAAPVGTEEAQDLLTALRASRNFADCRAALLAYALRRTLEEIAGDLRMQAAWRIGGLEDAEGRLAHRDGLAAAGKGEVLISGGGVVRAAGKMSGSVPPFGAESGERRPWQEAGLLEPVLDLDSLKREG